MRDSIGANKAIGLGILPWDSFYSKKSNWKFVVGQIVKITKTEYGTIPCGTILTINHVDYHERSGIYVSYNGYNIPLSREEFVVIEDLKNE